MRRVVSLAALMGARWRRGERGEQGTPRRDRSLLTRTSVAVAVARLVDADPVPALWAPTPVCIRLVGRGFVTLLYRPIGSFLRGFQ
jgi:hypothetical protein